jgi:hypothetical protein
MAIFFRATPNQAFRYAHLFAFQSHHYRRILTLISRSTLIYALLCASRTSRSAKLRALGVTSAKRLSELPDVPPIAATLPATSCWAGPGSGAGEAPKDAVDTLHKAAVAA